jgi:tetratricopeptide (TPR) repeat protein
MNDGSDSKQFLKVVKWAVLLLLVLFMIQALVGVLDSLDVIGYQPEGGNGEASAEDVLEQAQAAANTAENTANNVQTLLSFLEGAGVLVGLALGAVAYVGIRNLSDVRKQIRDEIDPRVNELAKLVALLETYQDSLKALPDQLETNRHLQQNYSDLLIASQELRLNNYLEAYAAAMRVLDRDENNAPALYTAGWLELQYIAGKREEGIQKLEQVMRVQPEWPTARAAYGVGLRRKARDVTNEAERRLLFRRAEGELLGALGQSPHLLDLNLESFWGPVGGIRREIENDAGAIEAYREALKVTPTSSYPQGNLAALLLKRAKTKQERDEALDAFKKTLEFAKIELAINPGDYYHVMDVAMSNMILGQFDSAFIMLDAALDMHVTREPLNTSLHAGWQFLYDNCPDEWAEVKQNLGTAIERVKQAIEERQPTS